jgi:dipeptidyl aminopeptidase/acylaminoacyl peptidase
MFARFGRRGLLVAVVLLSTCAVAFAQPAKRPITAADYDAWNTIQSQTVSRDGKFLAYLVGPTAGDREYVIRNLASGVEWRHKTAGVAPEALSGEPSAEPPTTPPRLPVGRFGGPVRIAFTPDSKQVLFLVTPTRDEVQQALKDKKEPPKSCLCLQDLKTGAISRIEKVSSFEMPVDAAGYLAYRLERPTPEKPTKPSTKSEPKPDEDEEASEDDDQPMKPPFKPTTPTTGSDLILRNLADNSERTIAEVTTFSFTKDGKQLLYVIASKKEETSGIYLLTLGSSAPAAPILTGKGRYSSLTWDEKQTQLAFLSDRDDATAGVAKPKLKTYLWPRQTTAVTSSSLFPKPSAAALATDVITAGTPGLPKDWEIVDRGLAFSSDGQGLYVSVAPVREPVKEPLAAERVNLELWHWKDEVIVPMQKVRPTSTNPSYRAVFHLRDRKLVQVTDDAMAGINFARNGSWAYGSDDRPYRTLVGFDANYSDFYLVNVETGKRQPLMQKKEGGLTWSPGGKFLLYHDGKHWNSVSVPALKTTNLTKDLPANFYREDHDTPSTATSYLLAGWIADDKGVILYDRFDLWLVAPDGSGAKNLTQGQGRKLGIAFRYLNFDTEERTVDLTKPMLLRAENLDTRDQGFYRLHPNGRLETLIMAARSFGFPAKAKDADVIVLTSSTFYDAPDLYVTDTNFKELRKVTNLNPQKEQLIWGRAELIKYRSADGTPLSGILVKPENFDPTKKYPMIVYIYERLSQNLHNFVPPRAGTSINPTFYASNGYLVLMPDIAYTVGYPGQSALKCVLPAIDAVVSMGCVDEKAIGIQGHSWGGYQIAYMVTQTNRFKAASAGAPVSNMTSAYGGIRWGSGLPRQFQYERTQSRIGGSLWQFPMRFVENSPVFGADRVQTPLMMLHNDRDGAVPWYQGIEYYLALRRLGKEVYLFNYVGEDHGLARRANQRDYTVRMKQFFDHHLKGEPMPEWMAKGMPYRPPTTGTPTKPGPGPMRTEE